MRLTQAIKVEQETVTSVSEVDSLPGCSQVAVSHAMFMYPEHRGKGFAKELADVRVNQIIDLGYDYVMCTADLTNEPQIKTLINNGWKCLESFKSSRTGHNVGLFGMQLTYHTPKWFDYVDGHAVWEND